MVEEIIKSSVDKNWANAFVKRYHTELKSIYLRNINSACVKSKYALVFQQFYDLVSDIFDVLNINVSNANLHAVDSLC